MADGITCYKLKLSKQLKTFNERMKAAEQSQAAELQVDEQKVQRNSGQHAKF